MVALTYWETNPGPRRPVPAVCRILCSNVRGLAGNLSDLTVGSYSSLFLKRTADVLTPRLSVVFRLLVRLGSFPACWRQANVTPIPKSPPSSSVANYLPIFITLVLSKVFERLVSVRLGRFMECSGVLPTTQFAYWKGLGTCDALLSLCHTLQSALESAQEAKIVQIDFSAAFDRVNHQGILYRFCSVGIGGSVLY